MACKHEQDVVKETSHRDVIHTAVFSQHLFCRGTHSEKNPLMCAKECFDVTVDHAQTTSTHPV